MAEAKKVAGNQAFKGRNYEKAIELYTEAIALEPEGETAALCLSNRSAAYQGLKKWAEAVADAKKCLKLKPAFAKGYFRLGIAQKKMGALEDALKTIEAGLKLQPEDASLKKARQGIVKKLKMRAVLSRPRVAPEQLQEAQAELAKLSKTRQDLRSKLMSQQHEMERSKRDGKRAAICSQQLSTLPKETPMYLAVGKMFISSSREETESKLQDIQKKEQLTVASLEKQSKYGMEKLKSCEKSIDEVVKQFRA